MDLTNINFIKYLYDTYKRLNDKLMKKGEELSEEELKQLNSLKSALMSVKEAAAEFLWQYGSLLDYNKLKKEGFTQEELLRFQEEDKNSVQYAKQHSSENKEAREHMFGFPANMKEPSATTMYLREMETKTYLMNACGDPFDEYGGHYTMDNKVIERQIVKLVGENLKLDVGIDNDDQYWGYVTSGGTEGNIKGINTGIALYPNAKFYSSNSAHYSVAKANYDEKNHIIIENNKGQINIKELQEKILDNWKKYNNPAVILLTFGTTVVGAIDDITTIKNFLVENKIPHYIHIDAALYGGIPHNQEKAPKMDFKAIDVDSISVSIHKYYGVPNCGGVVLVKNKNRNNGRYITYIGQNDVTITGSRDFPPYSALQQMREIASRSNPKEYMENVNYFKKLLEDNNIEYWLYEKDNQMGNTFLLNKPSNEVCDEFSLAEEKTGDGKEYVHAIIFPYMKKEYIDKLVFKLLTDYNSKKKTFRH